MLSTASASSTAAWPAATPPITSATGCAHILSSWFWTLLGSSELGAPGFKRTTSTDSRLVF